MCTILVVRIGSGTVSNRFIQDDINLEVNIKNTFFVNEKANKKLILNSEKYLNFVNVQMLD